MDALKKAELAKRKAPPDSASPVQPAEKTTAEAPSPVPPQANRLPSLPEHLELLDGEFDTAPAQRSHRPEEAQSGDSSSAGAGASFSLQEIDTPPGVAAQADMAAETAQREAVQNLFETKQAAPSRKTFAIAVGVATLFAALAIGLYFWSELQPKSGLQATATPTMPLLPARRLTALPQTVAPVATSEAADSMNDKTLAEEDTRARGTPDTGPDTAPAFTPPAKKLFQVSSAAPLTNPALDRAYSALTADDNAAAKAAYEQVLDKDPKNIDALSGLAVVAQRAGNPQIAADYYLQVLDADPKNALALAGLMNLQSRMNPAEAETRIKQALSSQPDSPALNFSLGNIYARSKRWNEAQQAYFKAMAGDPGNPDYLFNLAVSLEQLHQPKLAASYYTQAIAATELRPAGFDKEQASERLQKLQ